MKECLSRRDHALDLDLSKPGRGIEIAVWTNDADEAFSRLVGEGERHRCRSPTTGSSIDRGQRQTNLVLIG